MVSMKHIKNIGGSVRFNLNDSVFSSVGDSVYDSVSSSVYDSVLDFVRFNQNQVRDGINGEY